MLGNILSNETGIKKNFLVELFRIGLNLYNIFKLWRFGVIQSAQKFYKEMTVGDAMQVHPEAGLVFSSYHLGGCSHCSINEIETIEQVCQGYGVEVEVLLDSLNNLFAEDES